MPKIQSHLAVTYALLVLIWATTPLAIVWSVKDLNPFWALAFRFFLALPLALSLLLIFKIRLPFNAQSLHSYLAGSFSFIGSQIFTYMATQYLSSGIIALMFGLTPIMAGLIGRFAFQQHLHRLQWLGMSISVTGLAIICFTGSQQHVHPTGILLMLLSVFIYALSILNESDNPASAVQVKDVLPAGLVYVSDDGQTVYGKDVFDEAAGLWNVENLAGKQTKTLHITVKAP